MKLHIGCGDVILPGWVNLDALPGPRVDVVDDAFHLTSIPDDSVDCIYASHILDHFSRNDTHEVLKRWYAKLRPEGTLRLAVSDFAAVVEEYLGGRLLEELLGLLIGGHKTDFDKHGTAFDRSSLKRALEAAGFTDVRWWDWSTTEHAAYDDFSQAYMPHMDKEHGRLMSLNLEAKKGDDGEQASKEWNAPEWYALGDSHAWVFTGARCHPGFFHAGRAVRSVDGRFKVNRLGPWLAWNTARPENLDIILREVKTVPTTTKIILSFGEIDCRCQVIPRTEEGGWSIHDVCVDVALRYLHAVRKITELGYKVYLWNAPPQTGGPCYNKDYPIRGTYEQTRHAIECFNEYLAEWAPSAGATFVSIYDRLVHGTRTNTSLFLDHIHLNPDKVGGFIDEVLPCDVP